MSSRTPSHLLPAIDSDNEGADQSFLSDFEEVSLPQPLSRLSEASYGARAAHMIPVGRSAASAHINPISHTGGRPGTQTSASARMPNGLQPNLETQAAASHTRRQYVRGNQIVSAPTLSISDESARAQREAPGRGPNNGASRTAISAGSSASAAGVGVDQMHPVTTGPSGNAVPNLPALTDNYHELQLRLEEYRQRDRETNLKVSCLESKIAAGKKNGTIDDNSVKPRAHEDEYNRYARRSAAIAIPFPVPDDLTRPFSPEDHRSSARWSSTEAMLRGRTAQLYAYFPQHLHEDLRSHPDTQKFVLVKARAQRSTMLDTVKQKSWDIFDDQPTEVREAIKDKRYNHPGVRQLIEGDSGCDKSEFAPILFATGRVGDILGGLFRARHAIRAGRVILWGPSALQQETQGTPYGNVVGRKWSIKDFEEIPREFIAFCLMLCRFVVSGDTELTDVGKSLFQYSALWESIVRMLYEPNGQPVVDLWTHELLGWCQDSTQPTSRASGLSLPPTIVQQQDARIRTLWASSIPEPSRPTSPDPPAASIHCVVAQTVEYNGGGAPTDIDHNLQVGSDNHYGNMPFGVPTMWQGRPNLPSQRAHSPAPGVAAQPESTRPAGNQVHQFAAATPDDGAAPGSKQRPRPRPIPPTGTAYNVGNQANQFVAAPPHDGVAPGSKERATLPTSAAYDVVGNAVTQAPIPTTIEEDLEDMYYPTQLSGFEQPPVHIDQVLEPVLHDLRQAQAGYNIENTALVTANLQGLSLNAPGDIPEPPAPKRKAAARGRTKKAAGNATIPVGTSEGIVDEPQARVTRTRGNKKRA